MKKFEEAIMDIILLDDTDVISTSGEKGELPEHQL